MAKAKEIEGLDCEASVLEWADEVLRVSFEEIMEKRGAALEAENIEGIHGMRVATRRLRSALRDFSSLLKKKPLKDFRKDLKRVANALGEVRDEDVAIIALEKLEKKAKDESVKKGITELIQKRKEKRERAHLDLMETISATALEDLQKRFDKSVAEAMQKKQKRTVSFNEAGYKVVGKSVVEFCDLSVNIYEPFVDKPLHKFRISAKRLRYGIELYTDCWGKKIKPFVKEIKDMQNVLGEVHDADVWLETLSEDLKNGQNENTANLWLLSEFVKKRTKNYRFALRLWSDWKENDFIEKLQTTVS